MSSNSRDSILAWLRNGSQLMGWAFIYVFEQRKANQIIHQDYINRFNGNSSLPTITGEVETVTNRRKEKLLDFVLDSPRLEFVNADLNDSRAMLIMPIMGGSQVTLEKDAVGWKPYRVFHLDPLNGPVLSLELQLHQVPGIVGEDDSVRLDLNKSDKFQLTIGDTEHERKLGGALFQELFNRLPAEQRIYTMGKIRRSKNEMMNPRSFILRTQASSVPARGAQAAKYGKGAIMVLVRTISRTGGNSPGDGFKFLIADDPDKDDSATMLFARDQVSTSVLVYEVAKLINISADEGFDYQYNENGDLIAATAKSGEMVVPAINKNIPIPGAGGSTVVVKLNLEKLTFSAANPNTFVIDVSEKKHTVQWRALTTSKCTLASEGQAPYQRTAQIKIDLLAEYELVEGAAGISLHLKTFTLAHTAEFLDELAEAGQADTERNEFWDLIKLYFILDLMHKELLGEPLEEQLKTALKEQFDADFLINDFIDETIEHSFGQAVQVTDFHAPHDICCFGRLDPRLTAFQINPVTWLMSAGSSQPFTTTPLVSGLQWTAEKLQEDPSDPGTIGGTDGVYRAPAAATIKGRYTRVRIRAKDPITGHESSALVTVVVDKLSLQPLIQICDIPTDTIKTAVELSAGSLEEGALQWTIKNPVPNESGVIKPSELPDGDRTYHHGPVVTGKTYVLDEVEVKNTLTGATASVHVLALQKEPMLSIRVDRTDAQKGEVQLTALFDNEPGDVEWRVALGPGSIESGLYKAGPAGTERYALIFAKLTIQKWTFEGHLIVPLPLDELTSVLEDMSQ